MKGWTLKLVSLFRPGDWLRFGLIVLLMLGAAALEFIGVGAVPIFVAIAAAPASAGKYPAATAILERLGIDGPAETLAVGGLFLLAFFVVRTVYLVLSYYLQDRIIHNREVELASRLFNAILEAPYAYHLRKNSADILRLATQEVQRVVNEVLNPLLVVIHQGLAMVTIAALVLWQEPLIGFATFVYMGVAGVGFLGAINARLKRYGATEQDFRRAQFRTVTEGLAVLKELRLYHRLGLFTDRFHAQAEAMARAARFRDTARRATWPTMELVVVAGLLLAALAMLVLGRPVETFLPTLALFAVALARLKGCATECVGSLSQVRFHRVSLDAVHAGLLEVDALRPPPASPTPPSSPAPITLRHGVELRRLAFRYTADRPAVLADLSLHIAAGSSVAFVGPTGSGKSTVIDLLIGLLEPTAGVVLADGVDIRDQLPAWQAGIGYVPQSVVLLDDTIARNIALGVPDDAIDRLALERAVVAAQMGPTIAALPAGLETVVGERGVGLSGGQRQRVAIARALYRNPGILVMDEGTSALDSETERAVVEAVDALRGDLTIIMVAHRLSTVISCDRLFYLRDGCLVASGTYPELMETCPDFQRAAQGGHEP